MSAATLEMTAGYARDLIKDFQIKEGLEEVSKQSNNMPPAAQAA